MKKNTINRYIFSMGVMLFSTSLVAAPPHWTYQEQSIWGALDDISQTVVPLMYPYAECTIGSHQSPIDLSTNTHERPSNRLKIKYEYDAAPDFFNSGHAAQVNLPSDYPGRLFIGKDAYPLIQFHFHAPSEHVIGSKTFPAEIHFVHIREDGKMAVLGVLLDDQDDIENPDFQKILDNMPTAPATHNINSGVRLNPMSLLPEHKKHVFNYAGSLTTPPCSEGVNWYVLSEPVNVSKSQITQLESIYNENKRVPQNLNGRTVNIHSH
ncbi:MAG: carbonic anhydrase family protein [Methylobacter sp.]|nr:carbonic anhydrase family protein [Methylobacter sp.]